MLSGRVLITGGTGSLGTAILSRAVREDWPVQFTVVGRNESKISQVQTKFPSVRCEIADVRDYNRLTDIFRDQDLVIHAAAIKIVPVAEVNPKETIYTNVVGSMNVSRAAVTSGVKRVIGVSTDKACQPTTVYGVSKSLMESIFRQENADSGYTRFNLVRYGNVLGSNASVVPLFRDQVKKGEPITLTSGSMTRFWLSMDEAINLVLEAAKDTLTGVIRVPKAKASDMYTLARAIIPDDNYPIRETGKRASEKAHEKMIHNGETYHTQDRGDHFIIHSPLREIDHRLPEDYEYCSNTCDQFSVEELREKLKNV